VGSTEKAAAGKTADLCSKTGKSAGALHFYHGRLDFEFLLQPRLPAIIRHL
jgi:hypothetical protein